MLSINEIRARLSTFSAEWKDAHRENADAKIFWARFYECFGIRPESTTIYEKAVLKLNGAHGFIDSFIPGKLIVEHKSRGKSLDLAFEQASEYFQALKEEERPRYIITSDFARFRLYDLRKNIQSECSLKDLSRRASWFRFLIEDDAPDIVEESPINRQAAYGVSKLHEALLLANFKGQDLEIFLTRLLFCLFSDDTGIFGNNGSFRQLVESSRGDGRDTGSKLAELFDVLDTPEAERPKTLDEDLAAFPYVNGSLFTERTRIPAFDAAMRALLVECAELDWSGISPAIFGAMFQGVLEAHTPDETRQQSRRELGAHYTSERNIFRVIEPLFLEDLRAEFDAARHSKPRLKALYDKLPELNFLDPASGCGNFLVIGYRELRRLENDVIEELFDFKRAKGLLDVAHLCRVRVSQFHGIEIDQAAAHIARVALWITDHQMNLESAERFGNTRPTIPLVDTPNIHCANALRVKWQELLPPEKCNFIMGNPPFAGKQYQNAEQKADMDRVFDRWKSAGVLDYVSAWYVDAVSYMRRNPSIASAFVSTNSITQGEQVAALWPWLLQAGVRIRFAHRTFKWSNEGKGNAAVHCVIVGFGLKPPERCTIFDYSEDVKGDGVRTETKRINPYLVDASDVVLTTRGNPICAVPKMSFGSMPNDGGHLLLSDDEMHSLVSAEPRAKRWIRPFLGAEEFINGETRWCLWLKEISAGDLRAMSEVYKRVQAVKASRLGSPRLTTQALASTPYLFGEDRQPTKPYLLVPSVSSERREFVPIGFLKPDVVASNLALTVDDADLYHFAVLCSTMHNAWIRAVGGRLKSDFRYSARIVYNNFPWPEVNTQKRKTLESTGTAILDARAREPNSTLADLYDPLTMPTDLRKAHEANDRAVDLTYGYKGKKADASRVAFLFDMYENLTSLPLKFAGEKKASMKKK